MNRSYILLRAACLIAILVLLTVGIWKGIDFSDHGEGSPPASGPPRSRPNKAVNDEVTFPGLPAVAADTVTAVPGTYFTNYRPCENAQLPDPDISASGDRYALYTTASGGILRIHGESDNFPSISKRGHIVDLFRRSGIEIVGIGNEAANIHNTRFMSGLAYVLQNFVSQTKSSQAADGTLTVEPLADVDIVAVSFRNSAMGAANPLQAGLLFMLKGDGLPQDIAAMWKEDFPVEDARYVQWFIVPINLNPAPPDATNLILDYYNDKIPVPGFIFERKIRLQGSPPDKEIPPSYPGPIPRNPK